MPFRWDPLKNEWLKRTRGVSFEEILRGTYVMVDVHPKRPNQKLILLEIDGYIWIVPFVKDGQNIFLKTAFPNRSYTKKWLRGELK